MILRPRDKAAQLSKTEPISPPTVEDHESSSDKADSDSLEATKRHAHSKKQKKRSTWLTFTIGGLAGLLLAGAAAKNQDMVRLELLRDLSLDSIIDVIPAGILKEASDISQREKAAVSYDAFSTGLALKAEGLVVNHSVVMVGSLCLSLGGAVANSEGFLVLDTWCYFYGVGETLLHTVLQNAESKADWRVGVPGRRVGPTSERCFSMRRSDCLLLLIH
jgi:hypothetical protein